MVTAMQGAKLQAAQELVVARNRLLDNVPKICFGPREAQLLREAVNKIDQVLLSILPNNDGPEDVNYELHHNPHRP